MTQLELAKAGTISPQMKVVAEQARLFLNSERSRRVHRKHVAKGEACSMCGSYCAMQLVEEFLDVSSPKC